MPNSRTSNGRVGRRDEILATFIRHVAERGYDQANLGDIAGELGMSKGTIVHHFGTKAQLLRELEQGYMTRYVHAVELMWDRLASPEERLAAVIYAAVLVSVLDRDATIATQREVIQLAQDPGMQEIRGLRRRLEDLVKEELKRGVKGGQFRPLEPTLVTLQLWGAAQWMWTWFDPKGRHTPDQVAASYVDVFLGGILTDRRDLARLFDPNGPVPAVVRACMAEVQTPIQANHVKMRA